MFCCPGKFICEKGADSGPESRTKENIGCLDVNLLKGSQIVWERVRQRNFVLKKKLAGELAEQKRFSCAKVTMWAWSLEPTVKVAIKSWVHNSVFWPPHIHCGMYTLFPHIITRTPKRCLLTTRRLWCVQELWLRWKGILAGGSQGTPQSPWKLAAYSSAGGKGFHSAQQTSVAASRVRSISKLNRVQSLYRVSSGGEVAFQDALGLVQFCGLILEQAQGLVES